MGADPHALGLWALIRSDYEHLYSYKQETTRRRRLLMLPRILTNACMHATILVRCMTCLPPWTGFVWRRLLISWHSIEWPHQSVVGPGLVLPHPFMIAVGPGTRFGARTVIHHGVTLGPTRSRWFPDQGLEEELTIGDDVVFYPHAMVLGPLRLGDRAMIGAKQLVLDDVPDDGSAIGGKVRGPRPGA